MQKEFNLTTTELNAIIAALMLASIRYKDVDTQQSKMYKALEYKFRNNCYYGDEIGNVTIQSNFI